ncbi:MAG: hypothetical protein JNL57_06900 [Bacteroidetes bacterium]|nr:hypothetical protein [Bacteroidota bacterium]
MKHRFIILLFSAALILTATIGVGSQFNQSGNAPVKSAYWWKTTLRSTDSVNEAIKKHGIKKLYVRFFDVGYSEYSNTILPEAVFEASQNVQVQEIVPVVFIVRDVLSALKSPQSIATLAGDIVRKAGCTPELNTAATGPGRPFKELQIDCDWRDSAQNTYFALLREIKSRIGTMQLSVTLRLYPFRYRQKCGVPPADKAALMLYNLADLRNMAIEHAVYNPADATDYFQGQEPYPLPLDIALPSFGMGRVFSRNGDFERLETLEDADNTIQTGVREKDNLFRIPFSWSRWSSTPDDAYYYIRRDVCSLSDLKHAAGLSARYLRHSGNVIFFELGSPVFKQFKPHELETVLTEYR